MLEFVFPNGRAAIQNDFVLLLQLVLNFVNGVYFYVLFLLSVILMDKSSKELLHGICGQKLGQKRLIWFSDISHCFLFDLHFILRLFWSSLPEDLFLEAFENVCTWNVVSKPELSGG